MIETSRLMRCLVAFLAAASAAGAATFTVTNTGDSGAGSLRQAILDANANPGLDTIAFNISSGCAASGVCTIAPATNLPSVTDPVLIDGYTQPGSSANTLAIGDDAALRIELSGTAVAGGGIGLAFDGPNGGSTVRGLVMNHWSSYSIRVGPVFESDGNTIAGNFIGTDPTGMSSSDTSSQAQIYVTTSSKNTVIGGTAPAARNVIAGGNHGILLEVVSDTTVQGNYLGVNAAGTAAIQTFDGLLISSTSNTTVGGTDPGAGNVIWGANGGIEIGQANILPSNGNVVQGNRIGTDATGTAALGGESYGILGDNCGVGSVNTIGGSASGAGNLISGSSMGILLQSDGGYAVLGNIIGTDATATLPIGNFIGICAAFPSFAPIGGINPGEGNVVAFNTNGIVIGQATNATGYTVRGNSIFGNSAIGIWLNGRCDMAGFPTPNDPGDPDTGGNEVQNYPVISSVTYGANTTVTGLLNSTPDTTFDLDFYSNSACSNFPREFLQGETYIGSAQLTTDGSGNAPFTISTLPAVETGARISVTATDPSGNTSEFSQRLPFSVNVHSGTPSGGTPLIVSGTNFLDGATVTIGGVPADGISVDSYSSISLTTPALSPGTANDLVVTNTDTTTGTLVKAFVADFLDVPGSQQFYAFVTTLVSNGITAGIGGGLYGVDDDTLRQQMAVFILKGKHGLCFVPPPCSGTFADVPCPSTFAAWIEEMANEGITGGCGGGLFCPMNPVRRDQMAVFLLKGEHGSTYTPPDCQGVFADVPCPSTFANWIEQLASEQITGGCGGGNYCPLNNNTRGQMAVFITNTFKLQ